MDIKPSICQLNKFINQAPRKTWSTPVLSSHNKCPGSPYLRQSHPQSTSDHPFLSNFWGYLVPDHWGFSYPHWRQIPSHSFSQQLSSCSQEHRIPGSPPQPLRWPQHISNHWLTPFPMRKLGEIQRGTGCVAQIPLALRRAGGQRGASNTASPWTPVHPLCFGCGTSGRMSGSPPSERPGSLDSSTDANRSNLPIPRQMKSNRLLSPQLIPPHGQRQSQPFRPYQQWWQR